MGAEAKNPRIREDGLSGPNLALHEMHEYVRQDRMNYLVQLGEAARADLTRRRAGG